MSEQTGNSENAASQDQNPALRPGNPHPTVEERVARIGMKQAIIVTVITAMSTLIGGIVTGFAIPKSVDQEKIQGVSNLVLVGKWKYVCTDFQNNYQHGGRFYIEKASQGGLHLVGYRMFKDTLNPSTGNWFKRDFKSSDYLSWHSNWIQVNSDIQFNFEYSINSLNVKGYCTGDIEKEGDKVIEITGHFYQLLPAKNLAGSVVFTKITEEEYNHPTWERKADGR